MRSALLRAALLLAAATAAQAAGDGAARYAASCAACHAPAGQGNAKLNAPQLAGQQADYLARQLQAFADGRRGGDAIGAPMRAAVQGLSAADHAAIAQHLAALPAQATAPAPPRADLRVGRNHYNGICSACHGTDARGNTALAAPRLAGLDEAYLGRQYAAFKSGARGADAADKPGRQMRRMATTALPDAATEAAVMGYIATLAP